VERRGQRCWFKQILRFHEARYRAPHHWCEVEEYRRRIDGRIKTGDALAAAPLGRALFRLLSRLSLTKEVRQLGMFAVMRRASSRVSIFGRRMPDSSSE
jgi:hypothetical protein